MLAAIARPASPSCSRTYIFDNDRGRRVPRGARPRPCARGVEVRVLIDATGARY